MWFPLKNKARNILKWTYQQYQIFSEKYYISWMPIWYFVDKFDNFDFVSIVSRLSHKAYDKSNALFA